MSNSFNSFLSINTSKRRYGILRIKAELKYDNGVIVSRKRIAKIMKYYNLKATIKSKFVNTTDSKHDKEIAPNVLNRDFYASNPDEKYVGDRNIKKVYVYIFF
ncbi:MAG: IS3 family transposase [Campylobacteraceae bacterium]|nr:IS3 family transposase [Campylobacteraceae bacterium]